jgi:PTS system galactitol-specific IIA component
MNNISILDEHLIFTGQEFSNSEEVITFLSKKLYEFGYVKEGYLEAVLEREQKFPTGLYLGNINVAIPHADIKYANKSGIAIVILRNPVKFKKMDNPSEEIPVHIIFLLVIVKPDDYVKFLSKLTSAFGNQDFLSKLVTSEDAKTISSLMANIIQE